jgi:hypothetical protein
LRGIGAMWDQSNSQYQASYPVKSGRSSRGDPAVSDTESGPDRADLVRPFEEDLPAGIDAGSPQWQRAHMRQQIREFLRAVPRSETEATLALVRSDGSTRVFTRIELSSAIDRLRPRMRQIVRLGLEERWPRQKVCDYLKGISIKTLERDQVEALDILVNL